MSITRSGNTVHDSACNLSEMTRQGAVAAAIGKPGDDQDCGDRSLSRLPRLCACEQLPAGRFHPGSYGPGHGRRVKSSPPARSGLFPESEV
jgi:hypothetical protein